MKQQFHLDHSLAVNDKSSVTHFDVQEVVILPGEIARISHFNQIKRLTNHGILICEPDSVLQVSELNNFGSISAPEGDFTIHLNKFHQSNGVVSAPNGELKLKAPESLDVDFSDGNFEAKILTISAEKNLNLVGGNFNAKFIAFTSKAGIVSICANTIIGEVSIRGEKIAVGSKNGDLNITSHCVKGDPIYWSSGNLNIPTFSPTNADLIALAGGNITASGDLDVRGSLNGGRIVLAAGVLFTVSEDIATQLSTCTSCDGLYEIIGASPGGGSVLLESSSLMTNSNSVLVLAKKGASTNLGGEVVLSDVVTNGINEAVGGDITIDADRSIVTGVLAANGNSEASGKLNLVSRENFISISHIEAIGEFSSNTSFIRANEYIEINGDVKLASSLKIESNGKSLEGHAFNSDGDIETSGHNLQILASHNIKISGSVTTSSVMSSAGCIDIQANTKNLDANDTFVVGAGTGNGILGTVNALSHSTSEFSPFVYLHNGGTGGITLSENGVSVSSSEGKSGDIFLNASEGVAILSGRIHTDGGLTSDPGRLCIAAETLNTVGDTIISASSGSLGVGQSMTISVEGVIHENHSLGFMANGDYAELEFLPKGSLGFSTTFDPPSIEVMKRVIANPLTFSGIGSLNLSSNGLNNKIRISGYPLQIESSEVSMSCDGIQTEIHLSGSRRDSVENGLTIESSTVEISANGANEGSGGIIQIDADGFSCLAANAISIYADGEGSGSGGTVNLNIVNSPALNFGYGQGRLNIAARSGADSGNGGSIKVNAMNSPVALIADDAERISLDVSVRSANGDGGEIAIKTSNFIIEPTENIYGLKANGSGNGNGGHVRLEQNSVLLSVLNFVSTSNLYISADGGDFGSGGTLSILSNDSLEIDGNKISVSPGSAGNGVGGKIYLAVREALDNSYTSTKSLTIVGTLKALGQGDGNGGSILIEAPSVLIDESTVDVSGGSNGNGGTILCMNRSSLNPMLNLGETNLKGCGGGIGGRGGAIAIISSTGFELSDGASIDVSGTANVASGGILHVLTGMDSESAGSISIAGSVNCSAGELDGVGGTIILSTSTDSSQSFDDAEIILTSSAQLITIANEVQDGGTILFTNTAFEKSLIVKCHDGSIIHAENGIISFESADGPIEVSNGSNGSVSEIYGTVEASGNGIKLFAGHNSDLKLGYINSDENVEIASTGSSNIVWDRGFITCQELDIRTESGDIGHPERMVQTSTRVLRPTTDYMGEGEIHISNSSDKVILGALPNLLEPTQITSGGAFYVESDGEINFSYSPTCIGNFRIGGAFTLLAKTNNIVGSNFSIVANGDVKFGLGTMPNQNTSTKPLNYILIPGSGNVYYGSHGPVNPPAGQAVTINPSGHDIYFGSNFEEPEIALRGFTFRCSEIVAN